MACLFVVSIELNGQKNKLNRTKYKKRKIDRETSSIFVVCVLV